MSERTIPHDDIDIRVIDQRIGMGFGVLKTNGAT